MLFTQTGLRKCLSDDVIRQRSCVCEVQIHLCLFIIIIIIIILIRSVWFGRLVALLQYPLLTSGGGRSSLPSCAIGVAFWAPVEFSTPASLKPNSTKTESLSGGGDFYGEFSIPCLRFWCDVYRLLSLVFSRICVCHFMTSVETCFKCHLGNVNL